MKKRILFGLLLFTLSIEAQISNLASLASGEMEMFAPIFEQDQNVYGYFSLFKLDKLNESEEKFEYVILDKNLNKVANGEFIDVTYKGIMSRYYSPEKINNNLVLTKRYGNLTGTIMFTSTRLLDLDLNLISDSFFISDNILHKGVRDDNNLKKSERNKKFVNVPIGVNDGFMVVNIKKKMVKENPSTIQFYNIKQEKLWEYDFGKENGKSEYNLVSYDSDVLYFSYTTNDFKNSNTKLQQIDTKTGKLNFDYLLEDDNSEYSHSYTIKKIAEKTIIMGKISPYKVSGYDYQNSAGFFKIVLDADGQELFKKYFLWEEANAFIEINKKGKVESGYRLLVKSYFVFKDERILVLSEKLKIGTNILVGPMVKTTDFVLLEFDKDFNLISANTIEKDLSKFSASDFLFSQYLNDEKDAVFFYKDYQKDSETKEKNWVLGIVSIVDGKLNHEKIPMSSDDNYIYPYIAKEGYILLREFNKNAEFDEIRLERLNLN